MFLNIYHRKVGINLKFLYYVIYLLEQYFQNTFHHHFILNKYNSFLVMIYLFHVRL